MTIKELPTKVIGMSNQDYRAQNDFDSRTFLKTVATYGGEVQQWLDSGHTFWGGNAATAKGSDFDAIVTGILEGKKFEDMVVVPPDSVLGSNGSRSTKAYREWAANQTAIPVSEKERWEYTQMLNAMYANEAANALMNETVETQASVFFELDGHLLKVRPDAGCPSRWWDLKSTSHQWDSLFKSAREYGYYEQEWLYVEGAKAIGLPHHRMPFVFVQTVAPFGCRVRYLPEELVAAAGRRMLNTMEEVRLRRSTGIYMPADANDITELEVPAWAKKEEEYVEL